MAGDFDPLAVIESAYAIDLPENEWLAGLLEQVTPALDAGSGMLAYQYDASKRPLEVWNFVGDFEPTEKEIVDVINAADDEYVASSYLVTPFGTASEQPGFERQRTWGRRLHKYGIHDALVVNALDQSGIGTWLGAFLPEQRRVDEADRERWGKVAAHVAAALRLRRRAGTMRGRPDAILSPRGALQHAEGGVEAERANLGVAVRRLDRARGRMRKSDPEGAIDEWKVLVRARWSLVDQFESDGKRWIVAYSNAPKTTGPDSFTEREREVVALTLVGRSPKLIAYELGLSSSTVRVHLANASRKLGARTREELVTKYREWLARQPIT